MQLSLGLRGCSSSCGHHTFLLLHWKSCSGFLHLYFGSLLYLSLLHHSLLDYLDRLADLPLDDRLPDNLFSDYRCRLLVDNLGALVFFMHKLLVRFVNHRLVHLVDHLLVTLVDYRLVNLTYLLLIDDRLMMFMNDRLMMLMDDVLVVFVNHIFVVLMDHVPMRFLNYSGIRL